MDEMQVEPDFEDRCHKQPVSVEQKDWEAREASDEGPGILWLKRQCKSFFLSSFFEVK
jgi:hypothetical protein